MNSSRLSLSQIGRLAVKTLPTLINVTFHVKTGARFLIAHGVCSHSRAHDHRNMVLRAAKNHLIFWKTSQYGLPPLFFSGVLANYSETEIVAHLQQMLKEIREIQNEKSMNSRLGIGSPGEIRTLVSGSRARHA
jgi:predicted DNA repair protein MutK